MAPFFAPQEGAEPRERRCTRVGDRMCSGGHREARGDESGLRSAAIIRRSGEAISNRAANGPSRQKGIRCAAAIPAAPTLCRERTREPSSAMKLNQCQAR